MMLRAHTVVQFYLPTKNTNVETFTGVIKAVIASVLFNLRPGGQIKPAKHVGPARKRLPKREKNKNKCVRHMYTSLRYTLPEMARGAMCSARPCYRQSKKN